MPYFWLSFCDPDRPKGSQFVGVSIVEAAHFTVAHTEAWARGCNPGQEMEITEIPMGMLEPAKIELIKNNTNKLMDYAELERLGFEPESDSWEEGEDE